MRKTLKKRLMSPHFCFWYFIQTHYIWLFIIFTVVAIGWRNLILFSAYVFPYGESTKNWLTSPQVPFSYQPFSTRVCHELCDKYYNGYLLLPVKRSLLYKELTTGLMDSKTLSRRVTAFICKMVNVKAKTKIHSMPCKGFK